MYRQAFSLSAAAAFGAFAMYASADLAPAPAFDLIYSFKGESMALDSGLSAEDCRAILGASQAGLMLAPADSLSCVLGADQ